MFEFKYQLDNDLFSYADALASEFGTTVANGLVHYPPTIADGYSRFLKLNDFISIQIANYTAVSRLKFNRQPSVQNHLSLSVQDFSFASCPVHGTECNEIIANNNSIGSIQANSTVEEQIIIVEPGIKIQVLLVHLKENWQHLLFNNHEIKEKIAAYFSTARVRKEFLNVEQSKLLKQIVNAPSVSSDLLYYQSKVFALLDSFFTEILNYDNQKDQSIYASKRDVELVRNAEQFIINNLTKPFVGVDELAKMCCMSRTKFINLFQKIYQISSFEYYQKNRLALAYSLLQAGNKSVAEIAEDIGYVNVQNFNTAFEKAYGHSPKIVLQQQN